MSSFVVACLGAIAGTYMFSWALLYFTQDAKEPRAIANTIPFITPILGMAAKKANFYRMMRWASQNASANLDPTNSFRQ